jgi:predicted O-methyltransferase YrrM
VGEVTVDKVEHYLYGLLPQRDEVLREIERQAELRKIPIVGPAVGRVLFQLARMIGARTVFEMGSAIGYSTIWWARAVGESGRVIYTDADPGNAAEARAYFRRAGVHERVQIRIGNALDVLAEETGPFDIIFNDVDKEDYPRVLQLARRRVRKGGLFVTDNTLWHGRVVEDPPKSESTRAVQQFNRELYAADEFFTTQLPLRDGVSVALKL